MANGEKPARAMLALHSWTYRSWLAYGAMAVFFLVFNVGATFLVVQINNKDDLPHRIQHERELNIYRECVRDRTRNRALIRFLYKAPQPTPESIEGFAQIIVPYHADCWQFTRSRVGVGSAAD